MGVNTCLRMEKEREGKEGFRMGEEADREPDNLLKKLVKMEENREGKG